MPKNWLIRTRQKQILGPISREKLVELVSKNLLAQDDEICSGNGYWFYLKEKELVHAYIEDGKKQSFNPISEAKDVLSLGKGDSSEGEKSLETNSSLESTLVLKLPTKNSKKVESEELHLPKDQDLEYPDIGNDHAKPAIDLPPTPHDENSGLKKK